MAEENKDKNVENKDNSLQNENTSSTEFSVDYSNDANQTTLDLLAQLNEAKKDLMSSSTSTGTATENDASANFGTTESSTTNFENGSAQNYQMNSILEQLQKAREMVENSANTQDAAKDQKDELEQAEKERNDSLAEIDEEKNRLLQDAQNQLDETIASLSAAEKERDDKLAEIEKTSAEAIKAAQEERDKKVQDAEAEVETKIESLKADKLSEIEAEKNRLLDETREKYAETTKALNDNVKARDDKFEEIEKALEEARKIAQEAKDNRLAEIEQTKKEALEKAEAEPDEEAKKTAIEKAEKDAEEEIEKANQAYEDVLKDFAKQKDEAEAEFQAKKAEIENSGMTLAKFNEKMGEIEANAKAQTENIENLIADDRQKIQDEAEQKKTDAQTEFETVEKSFAEQREAVQADFEAKRAEIEKNGMTQADFEARRADIERDAQTKRNQTERAFGARKEKIEKSIEQNQIQAQKEQQTAQKEAEKALKSAAATAEKIKNEQTKKTGTPFYTENYLVNEDVKTEDVKTDTTSSSFEYTAENPETQNAFVDATNQQTEVTESKSDKDFKAELQRGKRALDTNNMTTLTETEAVTEEATMPSVDYEATEQPDLESEVVSQSQDEIEQTYRPAHWNSRPSDLSKESAFAEEKSVEKEKVEEPVVEQKPEKTEPEQTMVVPEQTDVVENETALTTQPTAEETYSQDPDYGKEEFFQTPTDIEPRQDKRPRAPEFHEVFEAEPTVDVSTLSPTAQKSIDEVRRKAEEARRAIIDMPYTKEAQAENEALAKAKETEATASQIEPSSAKEVMPKTAQKANESQKQIEDDGWEFHQGTPPARNVTEPAPIEVEISENKQENEEDKGFVYKHMYKDKTGKYVFREKPEPGDIWAGAIFDEIDRNIENREKEEQKVEETKKSEPKIEKTEPTSVIVPEPEEKHEETAIIPEAPKQSDFGREEFYQNYQQPQQEPIEAEAIDDDVSDLGNMQEVEPEMEAVPLETETPDYDVEAVPMSEAELAGHENEIQDAVVAPQAEPERVATPQAKPEQTERIISTPSAQQPASELKQTKPQELSLDPSGFVYVPPVTTQSEQPSDQDAQPQTTAQNVSTQSAPPPASSDNSDRQSDISNRAKIDRQVERYRDKLARQGAPKKTLKSVLSKPLKFANGKFKKFAAKEEKKHGLRNAFIVLAGLSVMISVFLPFVQTLAIVFAALAIVTDIAPWKLSSIDTLKDEDRYNAEIKKKMENIKALQKERENMNILKNAKNLPPKTQHLNNLIGEFKDLENEKQSIEKDDSLSPEQKRKKIEKLTARQKTLMEKTIVENNKRLADAENQFSKEANILKEKQNAQRQSIENNNKKLLETEVFATPEDKQKMTYLLQRELSGNLTAEETEELSALRKKYGNFGKLVGPISNYFSTVKSTEETIKERNETLAQIRAEIEENEKALADVEQTIARNKAPAFEDYSIDDNDSLVARETSSAPNEENSEEQEKIEEQEKSQPEIEITVDDTPLSFEKPSAEVEKEEKSEKETETKSETSKEVKEKPEEEQKPDKNGLVDYVLPTSKPSVPMDDLSVSTKDLDQYSQNDYAPISKSKKSPKSRPEGRNR